MSSQPVSSSALLPSPVTPDAPARPAQRPAAFAAHLALRPTGPATVIVAPPGSGKSSLLRHWASAEPRRPVIWLDLATSRPSLSEAARLSGALVCIDHLERLPAEGPIYDEVATALARGGVVIAACRRVDWPRITPRFSHFSVLEMPLFAPDAVVYHKLSATGGGPIASYYCGRNFVSVIVKNMPSSLLRKHWPGIVRAQLGFFLHSLWHVREPSARARLRGQFAALGQLPLMLRKRRAIQHGTRVSDDYIESIMA